ncbi:MAG: hypothetical protein WCL32_24765 [Planctomycetota bacterium]
MSMKIPRTLATGALAAAIAAAATFAFFELVFPVRVPLAMRGTWMVVDGDGLVGSNLQFHRDGSVVLTALDAKGNEVRMPGIVEVAGNRFQVMVEDPLGYQKTLEEEILELTDSLFVTQDIKGNIGLIMERVTPHAAPKGSGKWPRKDETAPK